MKILKRWHNREVLFQGEPLMLQIRAMTAKEAPAFLRQMFAIGEAMASGANAAEGGDGIESLFGFTPADFARSAFASFVRIKPGEEIAIEDGQTITSAEQLYDAIGDLAAGELVVMRVLREIQGLAGLSALEGKGSGSLSTSDSAPAVAASSGASDARPTAPADGPVPSIATPSQAESESSFAPV